MGNPGLVSEYWWSEELKPVTFQFKVSGFSDWNLETTGIAIKGQNMGTDGEGSSTLIWRQPNVVPEPGTVILLATGLMGLGGTAWIRRRRENEV